MKTFKTVLCSQCNHPFEKSIGLYNHCLKRGDKNHFCSQKCKHSFYDTRVLCFCSECGKKVIRNKSQLLKGKPFCTQSCAASYNNKHRIQKPLTKKCRTCDNTIINSRSYCKNCISSKKHVNGTPVTLDRTIESMLCHGRRANKYSYIRLHARKIASKRPQKCVICQYDKHVEVHHVKSISDFPITATLREVNAETNIRLLCPNHHWEEEHKMDEVGVEPT